MYDDYDLDYTFVNDYNLDEDSYYEYGIHAELEEDYARDGQDYQDLAYRHYAWYNLDTSHLTRMLAQKRLVTVTLDIMCYDDLDLNNINWHELLELEPNEDVNCKIQEHNLDW